MFVKKIIICYNYLAKKIVVLGGEIIRKLSKKQKQWNDKHSRKMLEKRTRDNKTGRKNRVYNQNKRGEVFLCPAPKIFSIKENPEETIAYFNRILEKRSEHRFGTVFKIDCSSVKKVGIDALIYLIAIVSDSKLNEAFHYSFRGNYPESSEAKQVFADSGFLDFVHATSKKPKINPNTKNVRILQGQFVESKAVKEVCDHVQSNCKLNKIETRPLYVMLNELMGNTIQHAYSDTKHYIYAKQWYLYAEEKHDYVEFVFLDTGLGIPKTVKKKRLEKLLSINTDSGYIHSALKGECRTQTKKKHRGRGLPQISDSFRSGLLSDIFIYSGKGCCILDESDNKDYKCQDYLNPIFGTLFSWKVRKGGKSTDGNN